VAQMSLRLRVARIVLRLLQIYLELIFTVLAMPPQRIGRKLFRLGSHLLDLVGWQVTKITSASLSVSLQKSLIKDVNCTWFRPRVLKHSSKVILYIHGGGFMICSSKTHGSALARLADKLNCPVVAPDYSLAPESPYPVASNQVWQVFHELTTMGYEARNIILGGESAGGCLALSLLLRLKDAGLAMPCAAFLDSPMTDLTFSASSLDTRWRQECLLPIYGPFTKRLYSKHFLNYTGDYQRDLPDLSPLHADHHSLPPLFISYSDHEILRDDARLLIAKVRRQGGTVHEFCGQWTPHATLMLHHYFPEGQDLAHAVTNFIATHLELG